MKHAWTKFDVKLKENWWRRQFTVSVHEYETSLVFLVARSVDEKLEAPFDIVGKLIGLSTTFTKIDQLSQIWLKIGYFSVAVSENLISR